jgi:hypothetical protein
VYRATQERVMASGKLDENEREAFERSAYLSKGSLLGLNDVEVNFAFVYSCIHLTLL